MIQCTTFQLFIDADAKEENQPILRIDQERDSSGLQRLLVDSAWSWISTQTFDRTSDGVAGRLKQEVQMVLLSLPICWECVWADSWFPTMLNCLSCRHWSNAPGKVIFQFGQIVFPAAWIPTKRQLDYPGHLILPKWGLFRPSKYGHWAVGCQVKCQKKQGRLGMLWHVK